MKRFKNILLYTDGNADNEGPLEKAIDLAQRNDARLTVVGVLKQLPQDMQLLIANARVSEMREAAAEALGEHLATFAASAQTRYDNIEIKILHGTPFLEITREVLRSKHDLVMMAADGDRHHREFFFGSTSLHLMRKCPCPIWVIKPGQRTKFTRVLAAVDPHPTNEERNSINTKVMELATSLSRLEGSKLHIAHFVDTSAADAWSLWSRSLPPSEASRIPVETVMRHRQLLLELLDKHALKGIEHEVHLNEGAAGDRIAQLAKEKQIDLIIMGTLARTGVTGFFIGNTAETVLGRVACSVLTVKPDRFASPVQLTNH